VVHGTAYSVGGLVFRWSQSGLYATAVGSESVYSWCDPVTWPENLIAFTAKPFFQVLRSLLVLGKASFTGGKVFRSSPLALCTAEVGSECLYSWFDSV